MSFRKVDQRWQRERLYQALVSRFGADQIFKSGESIPPGVEFADVLRREAAECEVMLVLIGPGWVDATDATGRRSLDRDDDWVRLEIGIALRAGNRVVPVLLGDATMLPAAEVLPPDITALAGLQFLRLPDSHVNAGLAEVLRRLGMLITDPPSPTAAQPDTSASTPLTAPATTPPGAVASAAHATAVVGGSGATPVAAGRGAVAVVAAEGSKVKVVQRVRKWASAHPLLVIASMSQGSQRSE